MIAVAIPSWNGRAHLEICLAALEAQAPAEILVYDNGSRDGTVAWLAERHPRVRVLRSPHNVGFAAACNALVRAASQEWVALLNNDTCPDAGWLAGFQEGAARAEADVAALAGRSLDWSGRLLDFQAGALTFDGHAFQVGQGRPAPPPGPPAELLFACGANMLVRRGLFLEHDGFDESFFAYYEDVELGWRLWAAGLRVLSCPGALVRHRGSASLARLGVFTRGFHFERNALATVMQNYDEELYARLMPAVLLTFQSRIDQLLRRNLGVDTLLRRVPPLLWLAGLGRRWGLLSDRSSLAHLQAQHAILGNLSRLQARRAQLLQRRRRSDRDIFARFPLHVVPTYPGDEQLFASHGFQALLGAGLPIRFAPLGEMAP